MYIAGYDGLNCILNYTLIISLLVRITATADFLMSWCDLSIFLIQWYHSVFLHTFLASCKTMCNFFVYFRCNLNVLQQKMFFNQMLCFPWYPNNTGRLVISKNLPITRNNTKFSKILKQVTYQISQQRRGIYRKQKSCKLLCKGQIQEKSHWKDSMENEEMVVEEHKDLDGKKDKRWKYRIKKNTYNSGWVSHELSFCGKDNANRKDTRRQVETQNI